MKKTISLVLVLVLGLAAEVAKADFTFGTPMNLGPTVNSSAGDWDPSISADGLSLYFSSNRPGGSGDFDLWVTTREMIQDPWGEPVNLGPTVNSSSGEWTPSISADGSTLYFTSNRPGGVGGYDLWLTTRSTIENEWGTPVNLGSTVNSSVFESGPRISADGLSLYFNSGRTPGNSGNWDIWVTTRATVSEPWGPPVHLGPNVNSSAWEQHPAISADGLALFFYSERPPSKEYSGEIWVTTRATVSDPWGEPVRLGPPVNIEGGDGGPDISADGMLLYFSSNRPGGVGAWDLWKVSITPVVDLNGDGIVDSADLCIMVDYWGTDEQLCDIGPMPWGDGIVDVEDLIVLAEHLFEEFPPAE